MDNSPHNTPSTAGDSGTRSGGAWWRLPLLLAVVFGAIVIARASRVEERAVAPRQLPVPSAAAAGKSVALTIEFGDGRERKFDTIAWHEGMTVDDLLNAASQLPDPISYGVLGNGELTLLTNIDKTHNEWEHGGNWTYKVNDVPADRSLAIYELRPGDRVLWTFGRQQ